AGKNHTKVGPEPAGSRAGVKVDDVVVELDGAKVVGAADLRNAIGLTPVGSEVAIGLVRAGRCQTIKLKVEQGPPHAGHGSGSGGGVAAGKMLDGLRGAEIADPS